MDECYKSNLEMATTLKSLGFTMNFTPVADLIFQDSSNVIGDRSFGSDPDVVIAFCKQVIRAHNDAGICPVIKHAPGHGRAKLDSHFELPIVDASKEELDATDFKVFRELVTFSKQHGYKVYGMNAHIIFTALDSEHCATFSEEVIKFIKEEIGIDYLVTDAIEMNTLSGSYGDRAILSLGAGADAVLFCKPDLTDMIEIANVLGVI
ncbi:MAG: glycoside hydrolase family 3 N-terminal domain-containing protein [Rickettsiaceae bacterium]|nr:glycoside hydrolase family 3 N-terminal domain-containing protein [Rickettsiaceae bacterium]